MKKNIAIAIPFSKQLVFVALFTCLMQLTLHAQSNDTVVVRLKSGEIITGKLITTSDTITTIDAFGRGTYTAEWNNIALISSKHVLDSLSKNNILEIQPLSKTPEDTNTPYLYGILAGTIAAIIYLGVFPISK
ncbi:MAG: hypothetical protein HYV28_15135 [Ignavibacteriales bacterium]|nr:hypothetical protein [Ignavibacteriales bacterium]